MTKRSRLASAFPGVDREIQDLRRSDSRFDEACQDFPEMSALFERLSSSDEHDAGTLTIVASSLDELRHELTERLHAATNPTQNRKSQGEDL